MLHSNEHEQGKLLILHSVVFWHQDRFMWKGKGCNKWAVTGFLHFKRSPNSLLPLFSSSLTYLFFFLSQPPFSYIFPFLSLYSLMIILLVFIGYSLNRSSLMSFSLTFISQRVCIPSSCFQFPSLYPISTGFDFKALITRLAGTATNPNNICPNKSQLFLYC